MVLFYQSFPHRPIRFRFGRCSYILIVISLNVNRFSKMDTIHFLKSPQTSIFCRFEGRLVKIISKKCISGRIIQKMCIKMQIRHGSTFPLHSHYQINLLPSTLPHFSFFFNPLFAISPHHNSFIFCFFNAAPPLNFFIAIKNVFKKIEKPSQKPVKSEK